jgi:hypothetical protein
MYTTILLLHDDRFTSREDTLLVTVRLGLGEVLDHCQPHGLWRAKAEQAGVSDIQRYDFVAALFKLQGVIRELTADLITDIFENGAGLD